jgi:hypothetical protein
VPAGWDNFYFMLGSAAAGLIGLLFVVVTLTAGFERSEALRGAKLYTTPTVIHFAAVLSISAIAIAPQLPGSITVVLIGVVAVLGLAYALRSTVGILKPRPGAESPHWSDSWFYGVTPAAIHFGLATVAAALYAHVPWAPHMMAALLLTLLLVSIRNAWDLVTWLAPRRPDAG